MGLENTRLQVPWSVPKVQQLAMPFAGAVMRGGHGGPRKASNKLGFLSRKKESDRVPKARERGVIGKEGARVIVGPGS